ncbi:MAG: SGNH/GDSL hydrolase family protein [Cephaloticoccus sp.]|nr:SGNH/GDSL hydrolase family protein [Cephaloticoccus sp.]MCF7759664.1 SGNH/GDSL hydrolase family protein [Cephaloticoccus sp.]
MSTPSATSSTLTTESQCESMADHSQSMRLIGESLVFIGAEASLLALIPAPKADLRLRSTYESGPTTIDYTEGLDYRFDAAAGTLTRLPGSRLPDFRTNVLHGREDFDHTQFPGYGNLPFFAYADYTAETAIHWPQPVADAQSLTATRRKLAAGLPFTLVAYGDSITFGSEASAPHLVFWQRWADALQARHPTARIKTVNAATGGDTTTQGLERLNEKILPQQPDLVLIGFGMNDHNRDSVPLLRFKTQLTEIVTRIHERTGAETLLYSTFPPNPNWRHGSHQMAAYARATAEVAAATGSAFVDVYAAWQIFAARKRPEDLLANNINHPNDFGHWLYYEALEELKL